MKSSGLKRGILCAAVLILGVMVAIPASAAPGERKGFFFGLGVGYGQTSWGTNHGGVVGNLKVGYAPTNQVLIMFQSAGTYFKGNDGDLRDDGMGSVGVQIYFTKTSGRGGYAIASVGYHNLIKFDPATNNFGIGIRGGVGYEFVKHWTVEAFVQHGFNTKVQSPTSFGVTLNWLFY